VLRALGIDDDRAVATLRFGLGRFNTEDEIDRAVVEVARVARRLRTIAAAVAPRR
jgi:cysteine desulfurase